MGTDPVVAEVLGIPVEKSLLEQWRRWYSPALQPFPVDALPAGERSLLPSREVRPSAEVRDTFFLYRGTWAWLEEHEFHALPSELRQRLLAARRRATAPKPSPRWPRELAAAGDEPVLRRVEAGCRPSLQREVAEKTWARCTDILPRAQMLAGTFPAGGSGANCFAAVLSAAGEADADDRWMQTDEFGRWLEDETTPVQGTAHDMDPGTVLVWREHGELAHAAVTIGDGWALVKPSQSWSSPRIVRPVREVIMGWRYPGTRPERHRRAGQRRFTAPSGSRR